MTGVHARLCALLVALLSVAPTPARAHDIPRDVTVLVFAKPEGQTLRLLVRVPLKGIMDVEFPRRERDYVDIPRADQALRDAATAGIVRTLDIREDGRSLPAPRLVSVRMALESDKSFATYETALAHVTGPPLPPDTTLFWEQGLLDVLLEYPIQSDRSRFAVHAAFDRLGLSVLTALRFLPPGGAVRAFELQGDAGLVELDPRWHQAALRFVRLGFSHILEGADHLLFLLCLVIPSRRPRALIGIVTAFTVAHSVTLLASAYGYAPDALWFPPLIETLIAMSIVYVAIENIVGASLSRRWALTFAFGLVHGFGFSFGLQHTLQFAGSHLVTSLLAFNVGVELGQLLVLAVLVPALGLLFRFVVAERMGTIILSAFVAHAGWHWMVERLEMLRQFPWPTVTAAGLASGIRLLMLAIVAAAIAWWVSAAARRAGSDKTADESLPGPGRAGRPANP
jgi:hypothetical protein